MVLFLHFFLYLCCFYVLMVSYLSASRFSLPVSPSTSLPLQLVFIRSLYSCAVRLSSVGGSFSLVSTCSPSSPAPSSARGLCAFRVSFFSSGLPPFPFFVSFLILQLLLLYWFHLSLSLSHTRSPSRIISP